MCHHIILRWACGCEVQHIKENCSRHPDCANSTFDENWTAYDCPTHRGKLHPHSHLYGPGETRYQGGSYSVRMGKDTACEFGDVYDYGDASKHQEQIEHQQRSDYERYEKEARKREREERLKREDELRREDLRNRLWK